MLRTAYLRLRRSLWVRLRGYLEDRGLVPRAQPIDLHVAMSRRRDVVVETVVDVGASDGRWSSQMMRHFPKATYFLVEAQATAHREALEQFKAEHANVEFALCAAGNADGEIFFDASDPLGGAAGATPFSAHNVVVPMRTVDTLVRERGLRGPFLLKLDTHGFEAPILNGARETLAQCSMLVIEVYNFTLRPGCLRFYELCSLLETRGFRCADLFDVMVRPGDHTLWQMDMVFLPSTHPVFRQDSYHPEPHSCTRASGGP